MIKYITVRSRHRNDLIDITAQVAGELEGAEGKNGVCYLYVPHTTAGLTINEGADPAVRVDILKTLDKLVPRYGDYRHMEGNSDAHVKSSLIGVSVFVPYEDGKLILGTWQSIYFCEFDGPRHRRVALKFIPG